jgi:competence protein ComEC
MALNTKISAKSFPFLRLLIALVAGIIIQWHYGVTLTTIIICGSLILLLLAGFCVLPASKKFMLNWLRGILILLLFVCVGMATTWRQNIQNNSNWYGKIYQPGDTVILTMQEPLAEKENSYKALAAVDQILKGGQLHTTTGNVLVYFKKDSIKPSLQYGSQIVCNKPLQQVQNSGNPAALNYNRYCLFQNITNQAFLATKDYSTFSSKKINPLQKFLFDAREWALRTLRQNIHSPKELGIAEALLIGYRNDLDKDLVQAYSDTGVVHIIAISGLHIGVIYSTLILLFSLFKSSEFKRWIEPVVILSVIWLFTSIAGAAPSVLRAAVMFTFILFGKFLNKNGNIYNTLAASAFVLLISNPFYLWDVGFQLSYAAVLSILIFFKSISGLLYFKNKFLRWIWQLCAVSLSAQVFTLPLVIYHFHQLPLLFLFSNLLAVPLSGVILFEELVLFCFSWWHVVAAIVGRVTEVCIRLMNDFIGHIDKLSFSVWDGLYVSRIQLIVMFIIVCLFSFWIFSKSAKTFIAGLLFISLFFILRDADHIHDKLQGKIIVYNVPKQSAVDFISSDNCSYAGDSVVLQDTFLKNFNLKPSRVINKVYSKTDNLLPDITNCVITVNSCKILMLTRSFHTLSPKEKIKLNVLILSQNIVQSPSELNDIFQCDYVIADSSVPIWRSAKWKKEFEQLHLRFHSVAQDGAFTLKL